MSGRARRRRRYKRRRALPVRLKSHLAYARYWLLRLTEFPALLAESQGLQKMYWLMRRCERTWVDALADIGVYTHTLLLPVPKGMRSDHVEERRDK